MDLGAGICTPRRPSCLVVPSAAGLRRAAQGIAAPADAAERNERPQRVGFAFVALREDGTCCCASGRKQDCSAACSRSRDGMGRSAAAGNGSAALGALRADWWAVPATVVHVFTHFRLELIVYRALVPADATLTFWAEPERCRWVPRRDLHAAAVPSVMRKVIAHALSEN